MNYNPAAIEFYAFIGLAAWLVFVSPWTGRRKREDEDKQETSAPVEAKADDKAGAE